MLFRIYRSAVRDVHQLRPQDDEELQWLAVAKQGKGVEKSEKRQESAETEYHRLLCQESMQQVRGKCSHARVYCGFCFPE